MSVEHFHQHHETERTQEPTPIGDAVLIQLHERVQERRRVAAEHRMLDSFVGFCKQEFAVDPTSVDPRQSETIALGARAFLAATIDRRIETLKALAHDNDAQTSQFVFAIPAAPVERTIRWYYKEFGYNRRTKSDELRKKEEAWLKATMGSDSPLHVNIYVGGDTDDEGNETPLKRIPRASYFQEIALGLELERVLRERSYEVAADGVQVLLGAYGAWFPESTTRVLDSRRTLIRTAERDNQLVYRFKPGDILNDLPPDRPQKPLPPR